MHPLPPADDPWGLGPDDNSEAGMRRRLLEMMREGGCPQPNAVLAAAKRLFQDGAYCWHGSGVGRASAAPAASRAPAACCLIHNPTLAHACMQGWTPRVRFAPPTS